jgi:hypothetical protein
MRTDGGREMGRPRGAVLWPLGLLLTAVATGFGMWHALMHDVLTPAAALATEGASERQLVRGAAR